MTNSFSHISRVVGVLLLVGLSLYSVFKAFAAVKTDLFSTSIEGSPVIQYVNRYERLRGSLPKRGVVGYVTDVPASEFGTDLETSARYFITQYALAPLIVENSPCRELVVGNFYDPGKIYGAAGDGMILFEYYKNGLALYRNTGGCP